MAQSSQPSSGKIIFFTDIFELNSKYRDTKYALYVKNKQVQFVNRIDSTIITTFPLSSFSQEQFSLTIWKCRQLLKNDDPIAVERPRWIYSRSSFNRNYY